MWGPGVQGGGAAVDVGGSVGGVGVGVDADAAELCALEVAQLGGGAFVFVVGAADGQADAVAGGHEDRGRPDLDVEFGRYRAA